MSDDKPKDIDARASLRQRASLIARLANSRRQLDNGEGVVLDSVGLRQLFADLKAKTSQASNPTS